MGWGRGQGGVGLGWVSCATPRGPGGLGPTTARLRASWAGGCRGAARRRVAASAPRPGPCFFAGFRSACWWYRRCAVRFLPRGFGTLPRRHGSRSRPGDVGAARCHAAVLRFPFFCFLQNGLGSVSRGHHLPHIIRLAFVLTLPVWSWSFSRVRRLLSGGSRVCCPFVPPVAPPRPPPLPGEVWTRGVASG